MWCRFRRHRSSSCLSLHGRETSATTGRQRSTGMVSLADNLINYESFAMGSSSLPTVSRELVRSHARSPLSYYSPEINKHMLQASKGNDLTQMELFLAGRCAPIFPSIRSFIRSFLSK